jgi:hypothetical protein
MEWSGATLGAECTLEWRFFILETALRKVPLFVSDKVALVPPPINGACLVVAVILGPARPTSGFPRVQGAQTHLLSEGRLSDNRRVWVVYTYTAPGAVAWPGVTNQNPRKIVDEHALRTSKDELRAFAISSVEDGSLGFWDLRVERRLDNA